MEFDFPIQQNADTATPGVCASAAVGQMAAGQLTQAPRILTEAPTPAAQQSVPTAATSADPPSIPTKAERSLQRLRENYRIGQQANLAESQRRASTVMFATENDLNEGTLKKHKRFARMYSDEPGSGQDGLSQFEEFCQIRRADGLPLHSGYLAVLLSIEDPAQRHHWAEMAADNGWSALRLQAEVRQRAHRPPGHGRPIQSPATMIDGIQHVSRDGKLWWKHTTALAEALNFSESARREILDPRVRRELAEFFGFVRHVQAEFPQLIEQLDLVV